jgi:hypothetical protein
MYAKLVVQLELRESGFVASVHEYGDLFELPHEGPVADSPDAALAALFQTVTLNDFFEVGVVGNVGVGQ